jgi:uncharacterized protein
MNRERKSYGIVELKAAGDPGTFSALVSVFGNVDDYGDRMMPGSFSRTLEEWKERARPIPIVWSHQWGIPPIGETTEAVETERGLEISGRLFIADGEDHEVARQVYAGLKSGALGEFSFAFSTRAERFLEDDPDGAFREIEDVDLYEVGPTLIGANRETELLEVASAMAGVARANRKGGKGKGAKHSSASSHIQKAHDLLSKAGAKCGGDEGDEPDKAGRYTEGKIPAELRSRYLELVSLTEYAETEE